MGALPLNLERPVRTEFTRIVAGEWNAQVDVRYRRL